MGTPEIAALDIGIVIGYAIMMVVIGVVLAGKNHDADGYFLAGRSMTWAVIGFSLFLSILFSTFLGTSIPYVFQRLSIDPAVASGPFVTTINDSTALMIYLSIASTALRYLPATR